MGGFAWVTLATNDSYSLGALVLAHSLRRVGTKYDTAVLVTPGVTASMREKLASVFSLVQEVNVLDSKDETNLALLARPELGITFTKLHCWRLTQYEKCVFVDADTLVIRNCDELFEREELSAAPDVGWPDCFNSGVFVFTPSQQTFASITAFAAAKGSFDGGDQGLLNQYFSDWSHKDISKHLPFIYNMCSTATYSYLPAFKQFGDNVRIIHFIGITKPWLQYLDTVTGQVQPPPGSNHLQPLLQLWWNIFCENVHPQLSPVMASSTLASLWHELNPLPSIHSIQRISRLPDANVFKNDHVESSRVHDFSEFHDPWDHHDCRANSLVLVSSSESHDNYHQTQNTFRILPPRREQVHNYENFMNRHQEPRNHYIDKNIDQNHQIDQNHCSNEQTNHNYHQDSRQDKQNDCVDEKRELRYDDFCESSQTHRNDHFRHEKQETHRHCHDDRATDTHRDDGRASSRGGSRDSTITQIGVINGENERQIEEHVLHVPSNFDRHGNLTDVCTTMCHSPPEPCTKSQSIATQSEPNIARQLESNDAGIAGALAKITLGESRSPEQVAFEEHMRKQSWEQGQIDYMGRDSFDNIWKKISETLAVQPQRQPSPPKNVAKPEKSDIEVAPVAPTAAATEDKSAAISEPAALPDLRQTEEKNVISELVPALSKVTPPPPPPPCADLPSGEKNSETLPSQSSSIDAAVSTAALVQTVAQQSPMRTVETPLIPKNDNETLILSAATTDATDLSLTQTCESIMTGSNVVPDSRVPIQVAESVLEAEVKESVSQDLRPVTEEAISSISVSAQESVPAVLETPIQAAGPTSFTPNGSANLASEIGNGIDAPNLPPPPRETPSASSATEAIPEVVALLDTPEITRVGQSEETCPPSAGPAIESVLETVIIEESGGTRALPVEPVESVAEVSAVDVTKETCQLPVRTIENIAEAPNVEKKEETCSLPIRPNESVPEVAPADPKEETCPLPVGPVEDAPEVKSTEQKEEEEEETCQLPARSVESPLEHQLPMEPVEKSQEILLEAAVTEQPPTALPVETIEKLEETAIITTKPTSGTCFESADNNPAEIKVDADTEKSGGPTDEATLPTKPRVTVCPMKPGRKNPEVELPIYTEEPSVAASEPQMDAASVAEDSNEEKVAKVETEVPELAPGETAQQSESCAESPVRPARTKDIQIPGTRIITGATPPTSPPIGPVESLQDPPTKVTKKIVKKIAKKTTTDETNPAEADGKKVTKKVVKKVVKKTKEDDSNGAEASGGIADKPKKMVKIVKKTAKATQSLDTDATVPETPPPGTSEVPVPPKRKAKTTAKNDSEPCIRDD